MVAYNLINIASSGGPGAVTAAAEIADCLERRLTQQLDFNDMTADLRTRSDEELQFRLDHDRWPNEQELSLLSATGAGTGIVDSKLGGG